MLSRIINGIKYRIKVAKIGHVGIAIEQGLVCGKNCCIDDGTSFGSEPFLITLHDNVRISGGVSFITHDGSMHTLRQNEKYKDTQAYGKIEVGENTFIGAKSTIMPNVSIGKNCIIGACSLVTKSIPDNSVAVGIPAKVLENTWDMAEKKQNAMPEGWNPEEFEKNSKEYLLRIIPDPPKA